MAKRMLIDATHPEETRVVVVKGTRLEEFDFETSTKLPLKGNIYLAKIVRVEPSLQAAFVEYGGNRHGFLAFSEIHPDYYQIPIADRQALLARQAAEEAAAEAEAEAAAEARERAEAEQPESGQPEVAPSEVAPGEAETTPPRDWPNPEHLFPEHPPEEAVGGADTASTGEGRSQAAAAHWPSLSGELPALPATEMSADRISGDDADRPASTPEPDPEAAPADPSAADAISGSADPTGEAMGDGDTVPASANASGGADVTSLGGVDDLDEVRPRRSNAPYRAYKIQEVIKRRQILLIQVVKEERGNKGAALTTFISLAGRYCVLMPNTARGGGISRKIVSALDRKRLKAIVSDLDMPTGMGVILRTAGLDRSKAEIKRDFEYLVRLWDSVRDLTLRSSAPCLVYEEGSLIKRAIRDYYSSEIEEILIEGEEAYRTAKDFMRMLMPSHAKRVQPYRDRVHLFHRYQVEQQFDLMYSPTVQLRSGGYIVINPTEALVSIDVNSGKSTREHNIEETAYKTNLEAAEEVARQLRLRDLAGLIVIDFIDMEESRNNRAVERRLKDSLKSDRARIQLGHISAFGLMEMSRQRLRPSLLESSTELCPHCQGRGYLRSTESTSLHILRAIEDEGIRDRSSEILVHVATAVALYLLNQKRASIQDIETRYGMRVLLEADDSLVPPNHRIERRATRQPTSEAPRVTHVHIHTESVIPDDLEDETASEHVPGAAAASTNSEIAGASAVLDEGGGEPRRRRRRRRRRGGDEGPANPSQDQAQVSLPNTMPEAVTGDVDPARANEEDVAASGTPSQPDDAEVEAGGEDGEARKRRRRGRRGGRRRRREDEPGAANAGAVVDTSTDISTREEAAPDWHHDAPSWPENADLPASLPGAAGDLAAEPQPVVVSAEGSLPPALSSPEAEAAEAPPERRAPRRRRSESADVAPAVEAPAVEMPAVDVDRDDARGSNLDAAPRPETKASIEAAVPPPALPPRRGWWRR